MSPGSEVEPAMPPGCTGPTVYAQPHSHSAPQSNHWCWVPSISAFIVFGMTWPGIEPQPPSLRQLGPPWSHPETPGGPPGPHFEIYWSKRQRSYIYYSQQHDAFTVLVLGMTDAVTHFGTLIHIFIMLYVVIILTFSAFTLVLSILHSSTLSGCGRCAAFHF